MLKKNTTNKVEKDNNVIINVNLDLMTEFLTESTIPAIKELNVKIQTAR
jgi:hypothetical protein